MGAVMEGGSNRRGVGSWCRVGWCKVLRLRVDVVAAVRVQGCISGWGLPDGVVKEYRKKGVDELYRWQVAAIQEGLNGDNLVFSAPTSGGKSLVAEILMCRQLLEDRLCSQGALKVTKRCMFVLPYLSIVMEKAAHLSQVLRPAGITVRGFFGNDHTSVLQPQGERIAVCTMEKANVVVNKLMEEDRLEEIACLVVDEVHMIGDQRRGSSIELMLAKILHASTACQIIAMSATMSGLETLRCWLKARLFVTNYRPIPLCEHTVVNGQVYRIKGSGNQVSPRSDSQIAFDEMLEKVRTLPTSDTRDKDRIVPLVAEAFAKNESILIFCSSRRQCESCAELIADVIPSALAVYGSQAIDSSTDIAKRTDIVHKLQDLLASHPNPKLEKLIQAGIGYHHAGMTKEERHCIESGFRDGVLLVITSTTTLSAGINLPAQRVILRGIRQGVSDLDRAQYLQMIGRAGRAGYSQRGESYIFGRNDLSDWQIIGGLVTAPLPRLISCLVPLDDAAFGDENVVVDTKNSLQMQRMLLEGICCGSVARVEDVEGLLKSTFVFLHANYKLLAKTAVEALRSLRSLKLIRWRAEFPKSSAREDMKKGCWEPLVRGRAVYACGLGLVDALKLVDSLKEAMDQMVLADNVHAIFAVMLQHPATGILDWRWWQRVLKNMSSDRLRVAQLANIHSHELDMYMVKPVSKEVEAKHARFAAACAIADLIEHGDAYKVAAKWGAPETTSFSGISAGQWQNLQADVAKWAAMGVLVCQASDWWKLEPVLNRLAEQASVGSPPELTDLMRVKDSMTTSRAKELFKCGIRSVQALAAAPVEDVEKAVAKSLSRRGTKRKTQKQNRTLIGLTGEPGLNALVKRAARTLVDGALQTLQHDVKIADDSAAILLQNVGHTL